MSQNEKLTGDQIAELGLDDWRTINVALEAHFDTGNFVTGLEFVNRIGALAERENHHPDLDLRYGFLHARLVSHDVAAKTERDVAMARAISEIAAELGITSDPSRLLAISVGLDTWDAEEIKPFWRAVLGLSDSPDPDEPDDLVDPSGLLPGLWFQPTDQHEEPRQRFHYDIAVPPDAAEARIAAALTAGGVLVTREYEPRFTVLADSQGNKVCVCTHVSRAH